MTFQREIYKIKICFKFSVLKIISWYKKKYYLNIIGYLKKEKENSYIKNSSSYTVYFYKNNHKLYISLSICTIHI